MVGHCLHILDLIQVLLLAKICCLLRVMSDRVQAFNTMCENAGRTNREREVRMATFSHIK